MIITTRSLHRLAALTLLLVASLGAAPLAPTPGVLYPPTRPAPVVIASASSDDAPTAPLAVSPVSVEIDLAYVGDYVWRGLKLTGASFQPTATITAGSFYTWVWSNQPFAREVHDEMNYTIGWSPTFGAWTLDAGVTVYVYPQDETQRRSWEPYLGVSREVIGLTASAYLYADEMLHTTTEEIKVSREIEITKRISLAPAASAGRVQDHEQSYTYWSGGLEVPIKVGAHVKITPGLQYASLTLPDQPRNLVWGTFGVNVSF